jgi:hypothetical protein
MLCGGTLPAEQLCKGAPIRLQDLDHADTTFPQRRQASPRLGELGHHPSETDIRASTPRQHLEFQRTEIVVIGQRAVELCDVAITEPNAKPFSSQLT